MIELPETIGTSHGPSVDGASPALLQELLEAFQDALAHQGVPVERFLSPGTSPERVRSRLNDIGLRAPDELVAWFGWHDGPKRMPGSASVLPRFLFWSLDEAISMHVSPRGQPKGTEDWQWNPAWLQIMGDGNGLAIHCAEDPTEPPLVRALTMDGEYGTQPKKTLRQVVSLCTPVAWWTEAVSENWYRWDAKSQLWDIDEQKQPIIRATRRLS